MARYGLRADLYSDHDSSPQLVERELYAEASRLGIVPKSAPGLRALLGRLDWDRVGIFLLQVDWAVGHGHFAPGLGAVGDRVIAPNEGDALTVHGLRQAWEAPGIFRQCVVAQR